MCRLPREQRARWFEPVNDGGEPAWRAREALRALVSFRELNLIGDWLYERLSDRGRAR